MFLYSTPSATGHYNVIEISITMDHIIIILMQLAVIKYKVVKKKTYKTLTQFIIYRF